MNKNVEFTNQFVELTDKELLEVTGGVALALTYEGWYNSYGGPLLWEMKENGPFI